MGPRDVGHPDSRACVPPFGSECGRQLSPGQATRPGAREDPDSEVLAERPVRSRRRPPTPPGIPLADSGAWGHLTCRLRPWVQFLWPPRFCDAGFRNPRPACGSPVARAGGNVENMANIGAKPRNPAGKMWKHAGPRWVNGVDPGETGRYEVAPHLQYGQA